MFNTQKCYRKCFYLLFITVCLYPLVKSGDVGHLTFCGQSSSNKLANSLVFVSTLDGKISALDAGNNGQKQWSLDFNEGPMLSSNIHSRELNNNGQWVRLIPSLNGKLYKFDGENLEAIPVSGDQLLHSSFRYSDDLVFSGGKETRSYGISSKNGAILYECGINGCTNNTEGEAHIEQEVLIVQRLQQTVRAVEPRTGIERWNFSVGQHNLVLIPDQKVDCYNKNLLDIEIKVIVPEGLIWAVNKNTPNVKLWQYKFDSPIVTIWREDASRTNGQRTLKEMNLFDSSQWTWGTEFSVGPGIYVGMHNRQLYVQENTEASKSLRISQNYIESVKYPWQPYPAIEAAIVKTFPNKDKNAANNHVVLEINDVQSTTALSVLYNSEYINGNGFYLYSNKQFHNGHNSQCDKNHLNVLLIEGKEENPYINNTLEDDTPVQVIIVSLWYWWKEVLIISISTAIILNFMLTQRLLNATVVAKEAVLPPLVIERHVESKNSIMVPTINEEGSIDTFKSRYLNDFEPVDCLGKGGYGVVFEAKNKIDDCNYAIKRIALPNSQYSRERVMREVKALAKLDHPNIVRYFNAWLECPPAGWQEQHDEQWITKSKFPQSEFESQLHTTDTKPNTSICITVSNTDQGSVDSACEALVLNEQDIDEDSFIVFGKHNQTRNGENVIDIGSSGTESSDISLSNSASSNKSGVFKSDKSDPSESILFKDSSQKSSKDTSKHSSEQDKIKRKKGILSLNLNVNNKLPVRKSAKMFLYIQMQLCQRLSLREWLKEQTTRDSCRVLNIFQQIVNAVEYVHLQGLIHRDLKPSNIFFAFDNRIKIGDFGLVTAMTEGYGEPHTPAFEKEHITFKNSPHTACVGTRLYMSPEQMSGQGYNYKVDIYSLGIILFELLIPFLTEMERVDALMNLRKSVFPKDFQVKYPDKYELLRMMLDDNPDKRPTTLGIKARPPLLNHDIAPGVNVNEDSKWHFELPQIMRHSSVTSSSSGESWENIS